jgi:hypothetical protein
MATTYRYLLADLLTNDIIAELPLTGVAFTQQLNQAGTFSGHLMLSGINTDKFNVDASTIPGKCGLYVDRDGILVWGGVIWGRQYNSQDQALTIQAREWISYFERRRITQTVDFVAVDQLVIAKTLIEDAQSVAFGDIGVGYNSDGETTSGILIDRVYYDYELKNVFQAIQDLSRQSDGFDFQIAISYDAVTDLPRKDFNTYFPRSGLVYTPGDPACPVFEFPAGNIVEYEYPEDGSTTANVIYAIGAGSNEGKLIGSAVHPTIYTEGWAVLEDQVNYSDVTDQTVLDNLAMGAVNAFVIPPITMKVVVPAFVDPVYGTYEVGDDARIMITDDRFPNGLDAIYRIVGSSVQPGEDGPERVTLSLTLGTESEIA